MANSKRKCANCGERKQAGTMFIHGTQAFCNRDGWVEYSVKNIKKLAAKGKKIINKEFAAKKRKFKLNDKSLRRREAVTAFNKFIRLRDVNEPCISCQRHHTGQYHAGHYKPAGINSALKFNELNVHKQCSACNNNLSGNLTNYRIHLIKKIGLEKVVELESNKEITKYTCEQLKAIEVEYKEKCKFLEQRLVA
ncbi:recombination protein NinG [Paraglaciecola sp.]|uniref:recombination protein NinG n=1 Tax=Paraglaciecola sp. TaxID=1920173 RepID=UPI003EF8C915